MWTSRVALSRCGRRKRSHSERTRTTRRVPLSSSLGTILRNWITVHPGGPWLFCQSGEVMRSKKRSRTTGHQSGEGQAKTLGARMKMVRNREGVGISPITKRCHRAFRSFESPGTPSRCAGPDSPSIPPLAGVRVHLPGLDGYLSASGAYPFHTHSMACGRNCCWALPTLWWAPRQNRYRYS